MQDKIWQEHSLILKNLLNLEFSPVAISFSKEPLLQDNNKKIRICRAILDASKGESLQVSKANNACFGASWHLGFHKIKDSKIHEMVKKFVVEGEKLFSSYEALDNLMRQLEEPPDHSNTYIILSPMEKIEIEPQLVIFVVNAEAASRLLTFVTFFEGKMPKIQIGGPTCRMMIIYPLLTGEMNLSFFDYTARKICHVEQDKLLITLPYAQIPRIIENIDICSGGKAKVEFPPEFRQFLQQRLTS
jgi:uncharacterized protein (DUF169 family)